MKDLLRRDVFWQGLLVILIIAGAVFTITTMNPQEAWEDHDMESDLARSIEIETELVEVYQEIERAVSQSTGKDRELLSQKHEALERLCYFCSATSACGEPFRFLNVISDHREELASIGATGCLAALDKLSPLFDEWISLHHISYPKSQSGVVIKFHEESEASHDYLKRHEEEINKHVNQMEDVDELKLLLIEGVRKTLREFGFESSK